MRAAHPGMGLRHNEKSAEARERGKAICIVGGR